MSLWDPPLQVLDVAGCHATPLRCHQHAWADQVYILPERISGARSPYEAPAPTRLGRRKGPRFLGSRKWVGSSARGWPLPRLWASSGGVSAVPKDEHAIKVPLGLVEE